MDRVVFCNISITGNPDLMYLEKEIVWLTEWRGVLSMKKTAGIGEKVLRRP